MKRLVTLQHKLWTSSQIFKPKEGRRIVNKLNEGGRRRQGPSVNVSFAGFNFRYHFSAISYRVQSTQQQKKVTIMFIATCFDSKKSSSGYVRTIYV